MSAARKRDVRAERVRYVVGELEDGRAVTEHFTYALGHVPDWKVRQMSNGRWLLWSAYRPKGQTKACASARTAVGIQQHAKRLGWVEDAIEWLLEGDAP